MYKVLEPRYYLSTIIFLLAVLLTILIPGGPIETRSFSHIDASILVIFNIFLTFLGMSSFILVLFLLKEIKWSYYLADIFSIFYIGVYLLDLFKIFPTSPDNMPSLLMIIEIVSTILAILFLLLNRNKKFDNSNNIELNKNYRKYVLIALTLGIVIVSFATYSAMKWRKNEKITQIVF